MNRCRSIDPFKQKNDDFHRFQLLNQIKRENKKYCIYGVNSLFINYKQQLVSPCGEFKYNIRELKVPLYLYNEEQFHQKIIKKIKCPKIPHCHKKSVYFS